MRCWRGRSTSPCTARRTCRSVFPAGLGIAAVLPREDSRDALVLRMGESLAPSRRGRHRQHPAQLPARAAHAVAPGSCRSAATSTRGCASSTPVSSMRWCSRSPGLKRLGLRGAHLGSDFARRLRPGAVPGHRRDRDPCSRTPRMTPWRRNQRRRGRAPRSMPSARSSRRSAAAASCRSAPSRSTTVPSWRCRRSSRRRTDRGGVRRRRGAATPGAPGRSWAGGWPTSLRARARIEILNSLR